jgi:sugar lactone lactonase YvrE
VNGKSGAVISSLKVGGYALGIDRGPDGMLYVGVCPGSTESAWKKTGGAVYRVDAALTGARPVTAPYPCLNGLAFDDRGNLFFASSNFDFLFPEGAVFVLSVAEDGTVGAASSCVPRMGLANGMCFDRRNERILWSDTLECAGCLERVGGSPARLADPDPTKAAAAGAAASAAGNYRSAVVYRKTVFMEAFDDLCVDRLGRLWMTDPIRGTIKVFDPGADSLVRYDLKGFGQASSCRIRLEEGREMLYVTELVASTKEKGVPDNGRGLLRLPLSALEGE